MNKGEREQRNNQIIIRYLEGPGLTATDVAKEFGLEPATVRNVLKDCPSRGQKISHYLWLNLSMPLTEVAENIGVTMCTLYKQIRDNPQLAGDRPKKTRGRVKGKYSTRTKQMIEALRASEKSDSDVAADFGVSRQRIRQVRERYDKDHPETPLPRYKAPPVVKECCQCGGE